MRLSAVMSALVMSLLFTAPSYALGSRGVTRGAASELAVIAREAIAVQMRADDMEAYLRGNGSPNWLWVTETMNRLRDDVVNLQKATFRFEQSEPRLTSAQNQQLERLKVGLATLTVFVNNTYQLLETRQVLPHRKALMASARAMNARADFIHDAARSLRIPAAA